MPKFSVRILFLTLSFIGLLCIPSLSYKLIPDNTNPTIKVSFEWSKASQFSIEREITSKLEATFSSLTGVKNITSKSYNNYGEIFIEYHNSIDIEFERFHISTLIRQLYSRLPKGITYPTISYGKYETNDIRLLSYSMIPKDDNFDHENFIYKILYPEITKYEDVNSIKFEGILSSYYEIKYDINSINSFDLTINEIVRLLKVALKDDKLGTILKNSRTNSLEYILVNKSINSETELYNLPLKIIDTKIIRLKDIATLNRKKSLPTQFFRINGQETINFSITADKDANQIALADSLKESISKLNNANSPYEYILINDSTEYLKQELKSISSRTLLSFIFLFLLTLLIYRSLRDVLNLLISLLATLLIAIIVLKIFKISIHIYSLMSIAISIGFVIDNSIITIDHYLKNKNKKIILPIFAATITTLAPLLLVLFLEDSIQLNLRDFSWTLIIILISSLIVSFFLIPSIIKNKRQVRKRYGLQSLKRIVFFNRYYLKYIILISRYRRILGLLLMLIFGIPLFLLPKRLENNSTFSKVYNHSIGHDYYNKNVRPITDKYLGGVLKLFIENSLDGDFIEHPERTKVSLRIKTPFGSTTSYINLLCKKFEKFLNTNKPLGIDFFQTTIYNNRTAQIDVFFEESKELEFPYLLKGFLEKEILTTSGADFSVFGVGKPYGVSSGQYHDASIVLTGYDYEKLNSYAELVSKELEKNSRIENVLIQSERSWILNDNKKYVAENFDHLASNILRNFQDIYALKDLGGFKINENKIPIKLISNIKDQNSAYSILNNQINANDSLKYKPKYDVKFDLKRVPENIYKKNQEYQLALNYNFKGTNKYSKIVKKEIINKFEKKIASGFSIIDGDKLTLDDKKTDLYLAIVVCIFIIFSICSILLESVRKSLLIISTIPVTFLGLFLSLYYFEIKLSTGVYGGLILLIGLLVNSSIFIINEYNNFNKIYNSNKSYIKAFGKKITPIIITITSTIVGLLPFLISDSPNNFWYSFAVTITIGLIYSLFTLIFILPIYLLSNRKI